MKQSNKFIIIFSLAYFFVLGMLFLLQISKIPWFFIWLVLMHGGIAALVISKKRYKELEVKPYYRNAYITFGLFIPILIYKLIALIFSFEENKELIKYLSLGIIILSVIVGIYNVITFIKKNHKQN